MIKKNLSSLVNNIFLAINLIFLTCKRAQYFFFALLNYKFIWGTICYLSFKFHSWCIFSV